MTQNEESRDTSTPLQSNKFQQIANAIQWGRGIFLNIQCQVFILKKKILTTMSVHILKTYLK